MVWKKFLLNHKEIPFKSLVNKEVNYNYSSQNVPNLELKFKILMTDEDKLKLPSYHQNLSVLNINYQHNLLIYGALANYKRPKYDLKINQIIQQEQEIKVRVFLYSGKSKLGLELIDLPYDIVAVNRSKLIFKDQLKFKFIDQRDKLLQQINLKT